MAVRADLESMILIADPAMQRERGWNVEALHWHCPADSPWRREPWLPVHLDDPKRWLRSTPALELEHPRLKIQAHKLTQLKASATEKAISCFQYVRRMPFKAVDDPVTATASMVLDEQSGDSHTKALLFVALLRTIGIPARIRFVVLGPGHLHGLLNTGGRAVSHAVSEVHLGECWMSLDAYCIDVKLALAARARLLREGRRVGYGVHMNGHVDWEGTGNAFGQFSLCDPSSLPTDELGVFDDPSQLQSRGLVPRTGILSRARSVLSTANANRRIASLRGSVMNGSSTPKWAEDVGP